MNPRVLPARARLACLLALAAAGAVATATAAHATNTTIVTKIANLQFGATIADCEPFAAITFDLQSPAGGPIGHGTGCITGDVSECPNGPVPGCHETVYSTLTFTLDGRGTLVAPSTFQQVDLANGLPFHSTGEITSGTSDFAVAAGTVRGQGVIFADGSTNATYVINVR
jgi:hypothetical protein